MAGLPTASESPLVYACELWVFALCPALRGSTVSYAGVAHFPKHSLEYSLNFWSQSKKKERNLLQTCYKPQKPVTNLIQARVTRYKPVTSHTNPLQTRYKAYKTVTNLIQALETRYKPVTSPRTPLQT